VIRFCPICDGYEAMDKRGGVVGDLRSETRHALEDARLPIFDAPKIIKLNKIRRGCRIATRASVETLAAEDADLNLDHVQPARMLGDIMELQPAQHASRSD